MSAFVCHPRIIWLKIVETFLAFIVMESTADRLGHAPPPTTGLRWP